MAMNKFQCLGPETVPEQRIACPGGLDGAVGRGAVSAGPGECSEIDWLHMDGPRADIVSYIRVGQLAYTCEDAFSLDGW